MSDKWEVKLEIIAVDRHTLAAKERVIIAAKAIGGDKRFTIEMDSKSFNKLKLNEPR